MRHRVLTQYRLKKPGNELREKWKSFNLLCYIRKLVLSLSVVLFWMITIYLWFRLIRLGLWCICQYNVISNGFRFCNTGKPAHGVLAVYQLANVQSCGISATEALWQVPQHQATTQLRSLLTCYIRTCGASLLTERSAHEASQSPHVELAAGDTRVFKVQQCSLCMMWLALVLLWSLWLCLWLTAIELLKHELSIRQMITLNLHPRYCVCSLL